MDEKKVKITKQSHACKGYASTYSVRILNSFNPELQLKDTESAIKNKLILSELRSFKFAKTLVLEFEKIENDNKTLYNTFIRIQKQKQLLIKMTLVINLNQSIVLLYETYKYL